MKYVDIRDLPPCSFSPQCLRLIDDLDLPPTVPTASRLAYIEDLQDERQLRQLRSHVPGCPTCSALLLEARRMRTQQRMMLYHYMVANERQVPSTSRAIFEAIRREKNVMKANNAGKGEVQTGEQRGLKQASNGLDVFAAASPIPLHTRPSYSRHLFRNMLTLATVAAVILAAIGLLNRFITQPGVANTAASHPVAPDQSPQSSPNTDNNSWNSVMIGLTVLSAAGMVQELTFSSYDTKSGQMMPLLSMSQTFASVNIDGISSDGLSFVYEDVSTSQHKTYSMVTTIPHVAVHSIYQVAADQGGNAVWMDTTHILVQDLAGQIQELSALTGVLQQSWSLKTGKLTFYHRPFLYFTGEDALYRVNLSQANPTPQRVTDPSPHTRFWLSADGATVFYANRGSSGVQGIYAVGSDGSNFRLLRKGTGIPIGYAADNTLMVMDVVQDKFQVIKLGATPAQQEKIIMANAAPGAVSLCPLSDLPGVIKVCDENMALAPYGRGLLLNVRYANGSNSLIYDNLETGASQVIRRLPAGTGVQLPGWSKMSASSTVSSTLSDPAA